MKRVLFVYLFGAVLTLESASIDSLVKSFGDRDFKTVCQDGMRKYDGGNRDEDFLGMVGVACAEIDYINPLAVLQKSLRSTKAGRNNASYFATLILQKKLLYQFMIDDVDLGYLRVPDTNHILSIVFKYLVLKQYKVISENPKSLEIEDGDRKIKLNVSNDNPQKVIVDIYKGGNKIGSHWYR
jgi:hypothetical protein